MRHSAASCGTSYPALFKSMGRDYMAGLKELIMQLYDCPDYLDSNTNNRGLVVIRDAALSILGAGTPAELSVALSPGDWHNGTLARFVLLTPEPDYAERVASTETTMPENMVRQLRQLHEALPAPPEPAAIGDTPSIESWSLVASELWEPLHTYERVLREMTAPNSPLDDRLRTVYGRLHVQALKVAIILAALDWIALGERRQTKPVVRCTLVPGAGDCRDVACVSAPIIARPGRERRSAAGNAYSQAPDRAAGRVVGAQYLPRCARRVSR